MHYSLGYLYLPLTTTYQGQNVLCAHILCSPVMIPTPLSDLIYPHLPLVGTDSSFHLVLWPNHTTLRQHANIVKDVNKCTRSWRWKCKWTILLDLYTMGCIYTELYTYKHTHSHKNTAICFVYNPLLDVGAAVFSTEAFIQHNWLFHFPGLV